MLLDLSFFVGLICFPTCVLNVGNRFLVLYLIMLRLFRSCDSKKKNIVGFFVLDRFMNLIGFYAIKVLIFIENLIVLSKKVFVFPKV